MPTPTINVTSVLTPSLPEDFVSYTVDIDEGALAAQAIEINERRALVENLEALRYARAL